MDGERSAGKQVPAALRRCCSGIVAAVAAVLIGGCASAEQPDVERVARAFAESDAAERCALLAPATVAALEHDEAVPCGDALTQLALPEGGEVQSSVVWGDNAQVRLHEDTLFLTRTGAGWKVGAAGCRPQGDAPYLCLLEA
jgi:hypothetical protein